MRLHVATDIDERNVRLEFKKSPDRPNSAPSYKIHKSQADEFVSVYNSQEKKLRNLSAGLTVGGVLMGYYLARKSYLVLTKLIASFIGAIVGSGVGAIVSSSKKNDLMDKYNVRQI